MNIISHRGYWLSENEKNTLAAFERSFSLGFGTETDVRDQSGTLVISHDMPMGACLSFELFLEVYVAYDRSLPLALNIKSDGLQKPLLSMLSEYEISQYFLFDMSVPDTVKSHGCGLKVYTRQSEYESVPAFYEQSQGVWMDEFYSSWIMPDVLDIHLRSEKEMVIVSPELHGKDPLPRWEAFRLFPVEVQSKLTLCTDYPERALRFFNGQD